MLTRQEEKNMEMLTSSDGPFGYKLTLREWADHLAALATLSEENANLKAMLKSLSNHVAVPATEKSIPKKRKARKAMSKSTTRVPAWKPGDPRSGPAWSKFMTGRPKKTKSQKPAAKAEKN
jgi:hypothetical protein